MMFKDVLIKYGYPCIGKEFADAVYSYRQGRIWAINKFNGIGRYDNMYSYKKYKWILDAPFRISAKCCYVMKKETSHKYVSENMEYPLIATLAEESKLRLTQWKRFGCNITGTNPHSNPMSFWSNNDILKYIYDNKIQIADCYGHVIKDNGLYRLTGECERTGCAFCLFGAHLEKREINRFIYLKKHQYNTWKYIMDGGEYDNDGYWVPNKKGLGYAFVIEWLNKHLKRPIIYDVKMPRIFW